MIPVSIMSCAFDSPLFGALLDKHQTSEETEPRPPGPRCIVSLQLRGRMSWSAGFRVKGLVSGLRFRV